MEVKLANEQADFRPWRPHDGLVFESGFAFDCETTAIMESRPRLTPAYVLGAAYDGRNGYFVQRQNLVAFLEAHRGLEVIMHHAPFDLAVIDLVAAKHLDIYTWVDRNRVLDTQILHRLYTLGRDGHTASFHGQSTLEFCSQAYTDIDLPKDVTDSAGHSVRLSYGQWLGQPPQKIEKIYLEYLARDVMATYLVFRRLKSRIVRLLNGSNDAWGYVSSRWLNRQVQRWGLLTHHIQLRATIVLTAVTATGMGLDLDRRAELRQQLECVAVEQLAVLRRHGYLPGQKGCGKALQEILRRMEYEHPEMEFPRTASGRYATSQESLLPLDSHEFVSALLKHQEVRKLSSSFVDKMKRRRLHPSFDVLKTTGRTSSFGEINAQNLPRDDRVRSCFCPAEGHVFVNADYATIEMATLAQSLLRQFKLPSQMAAAINAGKDLHRLVAAQVAGKSETDVTVEERQKAKPINFGKPGGMGLTTLRTYAKASYGVELADREVQGLSDSWFSLFPEMSEFLGNDDLGREVARCFGLTPWAYYEHTGGRKFLDHPANEGLALVPHPILGAMCLKALKLENPETQAGRAYTAEDIDFFWTQVADNLDAIPGDVHQAVRDRRPSVRVQRAVMRSVGRACVFTLTGRLRANASFCARHNTIFQGLAADGAKLGL